MDRQSVDLKKRTYTSGEVARLLKVPSRTIRSYLLSGRLKGTQNPVTGTWAVARESLLDFLQDRQLELSRFEIPYRILIVDDEEAIARSIIAVLNQTDLHFSYDHTPDGYQALIRIGVEQPDLVILDSRMPNMDGAGFLRAVRNELRRRSLRVLIATAYEEDVQELLAIGADGAILKPFQPEELVEKIRALLPRTRHRSATPPPA